MFDLPDEPPLVAVAASGAPSARIAAEPGDGLLVTEPKPGIVQHGSPTGRTPSQRRALESPWARERLGDS